MPFRLLNLFGILVIIILSCQDPVAPGEPVYENETEKISDGTITIQRCYGYYSDRDSITLDIRMDSNEVKGELTYKLYEKDANTGTIKGNIVGDTIFGQYTFWSEGKESTREVIFLNRDSFLVEGFGEMKEVDSQMVFSNRSDISFRNAVRLKVGICPDEDLSLLPR